MNPLEGVLGGLAAVAAVIAVGWVVGRAGILGAGTEGVLSRLAFFVAAPALLFLTLADADTHVLLSSALIGTAGSAVLSALLYGGLARWGWRLPAAQVTAGALASSYVNAGNLGIPVAVYVLGDASYVAPVLLFQVLVMAPVGLGILARSQPSDQPLSRWRLVTQPVRTPVVVGCSLGLLVAALGVPLPELVLRPVELVAGAAVPVGLLAYGMGLHGAARPGTGAVAGQVWLAVVIKAAVMPAIAYVLGRWGAGLDGTALLAVTVTSALPTAHTVFVYANAYGEPGGPGAVVTRDVIMLSTFLSVPVLVVLSLVLG